MKWLIENQTADYRFATTWVVMCESFYLIKNLISYSTAVALFEAYSRSEFDIVDFKLEQSTRMIEIMRKYEDLDIDLADISMVILAEHLNNGEILTVDNNDFDASLRWSRNRRFKILLR